jgi:hypothetical protein
MNCLPGLALNLSPPHLHLPSSIITGVNHQHLTSNFDTIINVITLNFSFYIIHFSIKFQVFLNIDLMFSNLARITYHNSLPVDPSGFCT